MKSFYKYLIYISFIFLAIVLFQADYVKIPTVFSFSTLAWSFLFLCLGYIFEAVSWKEILRKSNYKTSLKESFISIGLVALARYIPGKVWTIVGKASYIAEKKNFSTRELSSVALNSQLIFIWMGIVFGALGLILLKAEPIWNGYIIVLWIGLTVIIFTGFTHRAIEKLIKYIVRKEIKLPTLNFKSTISVMPWFAMVWILWSTAFYFLASSLTPTSIHPGVGFAFPLAITLGVVAVFTPGGLGIREGAFIGYLSLAGLSIIDATTISLAARLWMLISEIFIFVVGLVADKSK